VNAILRFDGRWQLTMNGMEYPGATEGGTEMTGAAHEPPVKEAIEALNQATVKPDREEGADGDGDTEGDHVEAQADRLRGHRLLQVGDHKVPGTAP
jgi:hypothetical protein